jgi:hypothetical protein
MQLQLTSGETGCVVPLDEPSYREILGEKWRNIEMEKRLGPQ